MKITPSIVSNVHDIDFMNKIRTYSSKDDIRIVKVNQVNEQQQQQQQQPQQQQMIEESTVHNDVQTEAANTEQNATLIDDDTANALQTVIDIVQNMDQYVEIDKSIIDMYNRVKETTTKLVKGGKLKSNNIEIIQFDDEREKKQFFTMVLSSLGGIHNFSRSAMGSFCNFINTFSRNYGLDVQIDCRYTTMLKNLLLLTDWNNMRLRQLFSNSICFCLCFDGQSSHKYKAVGISCRFITTSIHVQEELIDVDLYDEEDSSGLSYYLYIVSVLEHIGGSVFNKCIGCTTDGASNMRGQNVGLVTLIQNKVKFDSSSINLNDVYFVSIHCFPHRHNLSIQEMCKDQFIGLLIKIGKWLANSVEDDFKKFCDVMNLKYIPKISATRWCYTADVVHYLLMNYIGIVQYLNIGTNANDLKNHLDNEYYSTCSFESEAFKIMLTGADCLFSDIKTLNTVLQSRYLTVRECYDLVNKHIKQLFKAIDDIKLFKLDNHTIELNSMLFNCLKIVNEENTFTLEIISKFISRYLKDLINKFVCIENTVCILEEVQSFEKYQERSVKFNSKSTIYKVIVLLEGFENQTNECPEGLPAIVLNEYHMFVEEYQIKVNTVPMQSRLRITDCILLFGFQKYRNLLYFICGSYCSLPSSCRIESTFSGASRTFRGQMTSNTFKGKMFAQDMLHQY